MENVIGNLFSNLPEKGSEEVFDTLVNEPGLKVERIVSNGQTTPEGDWYDQDHDEWVLVAQGTGVILFEGGLTETLAKGDYLLIPRHRKHRVSYTEPDTIWLAIHFGKSSATG